MRTDKGPGKYYVGKRPRKKVWKDRKGFNRKRVQIGKSIPRGPQVHREKQRVWQDREVSDLPQGMTGRVW